MDTNTSPAARDFTTIDVIPEYLYRYLIRKGVNPDRMLSDETLDKFLSTEELAAIIYVNSVSFQDEIKKGIWLAVGSSVDEIRGRHRNDSQARLTAKVDAAFTLAGTIGIQKDLQAQLNTSSSETSPSYDFVAMGPKIWLVLKSGFLAVLKNPGERLQFYRDYLVAMGKSSSFAAVASTDVFANYVEELLG